MEGTKPSKTFTIETKNLNENQDMKDDKDNLTPVESRYNRPRIHNLHMTI